MRGELHSLVALEQLLRETVINRLALLDRQAESGKEYSNDAPGAGAADEVDAGHECVIGDFLADGSDHHNARCTLHTSAVESDDILPVTG